MLQRDALCAQSTINALSVSKAAQMKTLHDFQMKTLHYKRSQRVKGSTDENVAIVKKHCLRPFLPVSSKSKALNQAPPDSLLRLSARCQSKIDCTLSLPPEDLPPRHQPQQPQQQPQQQQQQQQQSVRSAQLGSSDALQAHQLVRERSRHSPCMIADMSAIMHNPDIVPA